MNAEIIAYSRARGIFAGVSLDGTVVQEDKEENEKLYGRPLRTKEIIEGNVENSSGRSRVYIRAGKVHARWRCGSWCASRRFSPSPRHPVPSTPLKTPGPEISGLAMPS